MLRLESSVIHSEVLDYNADCAEFCPVPGLTHLLALGTYQLIEERQERVGRCYLYSLNFADRNIESSNRGKPCGHSRVAAVDMPGIFDLKWRSAGHGEPSGSGQAGGRAVLGAALADGTLQLLEANAAVSGSEPCLRQIASASACSEGMCLSLDWSTLGAVEAAGARIATSSSAGSLSVLQVAEGRVELLSEWKAHSLEAWCAAFHRSEAHLLFSGADDCYFKAHDLRVPDPAAAPSAVFSDRRTHTAGVCTVSPHPTQPHLVVTGSYDENVRLWDVRNVARPVVAAQVNTGGGNWRLRWHPRQEHLLLAACMYNGFGLLRCNESFEELQLVGMHQSPNKHIGYGVDWWQAPGTADAQGLPGGKEDEAEGGLVATCSFYDKLHTLAWFRTVDGDEVVG